jgi:hypothetical protein
MNHGSVLASTFEHEKTSIVIVPWQAQHFNVQQLFNVEDSLSKIDCSRTFQMLSIFLHKILIF